MKLLESLFVVLIQVLITSCTQPQINFTASMEDETSLSSAFQKISLGCGLMSDNGSEMSSLLGGVPEANDLVSDPHRGHIYILVDELLNLTNYTTSLHENENITASFYVPRQTKFEGRFSCGYSPFNVSLANLTTDLVFTYVPSESYFSEGSDFALLFILFLSLFLVALVLLVISVICLCYSFRHRHPTKTLNADELARNWKLRGTEVISTEARYPSLSAGRTNHPLTSSQKAIAVHMTELSHPGASDDIKSIAAAPFSLKTLSSPSDEPPEWAMDELLKILSHPSPCKSSGCPCSYYKRKLLFQLQQSEKHKHQNLASSELEMQLSKNMHLDSSLSKFQSGAAGEGYTPNQRLSQAKCTEKLQESHVVETDCGYASVDSTSSILHSMIGPQQKRQPVCKPSIVKAQPSAVKESHPAEKGVSNSIMAESDTLTRASSSCYHASGSMRLLCAPPPYTAPVQTGVVSRTQGHLGEGSCDVSYPILYPDTGEEVVGLSNKFNLDANFVDSIETLHFDSNGGRYANENHEIYLRIPKGAIPEGKTISIDVGVSFHSPLVSLLPLESKPVSPLVRLCVVGEPSFRFSKSIEVTLPHFLDISDEEDAQKMGLQFLKSGHSLYCFHQSDGVATFKPKTNTATLKTTHFCTFCIVANKTVSNKKINYRLVKILPKNKQQAWRANFCVTYYLRTCLQALKKQFPDQEYEIKTLRKFRFEESTQLEINFERKQAGGWQMALETSNKISPEALKYWDLDPDELSMMEDEKIYPPRFEVLVCGSHAREPITALICFRGIAELSSDTTELVLEPIGTPLLGVAADSVKLPHHLSLSPSSPTISQGSRFSYHHQHAGEHEGSIVYRRSFPMAKGPAHSDLMNFIVAALPSKWRLVGVQLGLSCTSLEEIEKNYPDDCKRCFSAVFREWEHQNTSPYCWSSVIQALRAPSVEENKVAEDVRTLFMQDTWSLSSHRSSTGSSSGYSTENGTQV